MKTEELVEAEKLKKIVDVLAYDDLSDEYADLDDDTDDEGEGDVIDDEEEVMMECPDHCKCAGQYAAAMTATYVSNQIII